MSLLLVGYFPKITTLPPEGWGHPAHVREICSVSTCLARAPVNWVDRWLHNELGFFDTIADAESVLPPEASSSSVLAYRAFPQFYAEGLVREFSIPMHDVQPLPDTFRPLGFDAVSMSASSFVECSPLSCNGLLSLFPVNEYCLFPELSSAIEAAKKWSVGGAEPGDYYVFEVLRSNRTGGAQHAVAADRQGGDRG